VLKGNLGVLGIGALVLEGFVARYWYWLVWEGYFQCVLIHRPMDMLVESGCLVRVSVDARCQTLPKVARICIIGGHVETSRQ